MITFAILFCTVAFSIYAQQNPQIKFKYLFHPYSINHYKQHYRFLSHAFLHGDYIHLAFNMYALWIFGPIVEQQIYPMMMGTPLEPNHKLGALCYVVLYTGGIYASSIGEYYKNKNNIEYTSLGASGAINSVIFAFIMFAPTQELGFFFIPMPAWVFGLAYLGISFYLDKRNTGLASVDRVGHGAHFWGSIWGIIFTIILKPELATNFFNQIFHR